MNVEELDVVWLFERQGVHAKWTHTDRVQQLAAAGIAERAIVQWQVKRTVGGQPTECRRTALKRS